MQLADSLSFISYIDNIYIMNTEFFFISSFGVGFSVCYYRRKNIRIKIEIVCLIKSIQCYLLFQNRKMFNVPTNDDIENDEWLNLCCCHDRKQIMNDENCKEKKTRLKVNRGASNFFFFSERFRDERPLYEYTHPERNES
jgi:hypothetical protein